MSLKQGGYSCVFNIRSKAARMIQCTAAAAAQNYSMCDAIDPVPTTLPASVGSYSRCGRRGHATRGVGHRIHER